MEDKNKKFPSTNNISVSNKGLHARYRMTNLEKRAFLCMTADLDSLDNTADLVTDELGQLCFSVREKPVREFLQAMKLNPNRGDAVSAVKKLAEGLMGRYIDLNSLNPQPSKGFKLVHFFDLIEVGEKKLEDKSGNEKGEMVLRWQISKYLIPLYKNLRSNFTRFQLSAALEMKSEYSIRFYEYFTEAWNKHKAVDTDTVELEISLEQLRNEFDFDHKTVGKREKPRIIFIDSEGKLNFKEFNRTCLKPAIKEIEEHGIFNVSIKKKYATGTHTTQSLVFTLSKPISGVSEGTEGEAGVNISIREELLAIGISSRSVGTLMKNNDEAYLRYGLAVCKAKQLEGKVKSLGSYLYKAYSSEWLLKMWADKNKEDGRKLNEQQRIAETKRLEDLFLQGYAVKNEAGVIVPLSEEEIADKQRTEEKQTEAFASMTEAEKEVLLNKVKEQLNPFQLKLIKDKTCDELWDAPAFSAIIRSLIKI